MAPTIKEINHQAEFAGIDKNAPDARAAAERLKGSKRGATADEIKIFNAYAAAREEQARIFKTHVLEAGNISGRINENVSDNKVYQAAYEKAVNYFNENYIKKYERVGDGVSKEQAVQNEATRGRLESEIEGNTPVKAVVKSFYDEEKGGWQFSKISFGAVGGILGFLMGSFTAGTGGGGMFGFIMTGGLTLAGAAVASQFAESIFPYKPEPKAPEVPSDAASKENEKAKDGEKITVNVAPDMELGNLRPMPASAKNSLDTIGRTA